MKTIIERLFSMFVCKTRKTYPAYVSKQVILLMIPNGEGRIWSKILAMPAKSEEQRWHYLTVKKLIEFLRGITSKHRCDFYCLNCLHSFATENKSELKKNVCENVTFII